MLDPLRRHPIACILSSNEQYNTEIAFLLEQGIIEEANISWSAPILVISKPDGTGRLCVDYRKLNNLTEPDTSPMPRIDALLGRLGGATILTKLDMIRDYRQVPIASSDVGLTFFVTSQGHYQLLLAIFCSSCLGAVLFQVVDDVEHPLCYLSHKL